MRETPTQRGLPPELDRIAHERRAQLIAQLHRQAIATANDLSARQKAIKAGLAKVLGAENLQLGSLPPVPFS